MRDIAAVCAYFNPCGYLSRRRNYDQFRREIEDSGIELLTIELVLGNQCRSELGEYSDTLTLIGGDIMWQKERLLQFGIDKLLADGWSAVIWVDADITFPNKQWPENVLRSLERFDCVQLFETQVSHYSNGVRVIAPSIARQASSTAAGGGWAATRSFWAKVPLYQHCIVGGGDTVMAKVFVEFQKETPRIWSWSYRHPRMRCINIAMRRHIISWAHRIWAPWSVGYVEGQTANLMCHGPLRCREYRNRHLLLESFQPEMDIALSPSRAWVWNTVKPDLHESVATYFTNRREDD